MKRILVALMAAFVASAVFAKVPIQQGFESASGPSDAGFVPSVGAEDDSQVVTYASGKPSNSLAPYPFAGGDADASFGSKYLSIDTGDSTLWCANSTTGNVYFDMVAQFQPVTETSVALSDDAKFAVYLDSNSNVVVVAGNGVYPSTVTNANVTTTKLDPGAWARVTIAATNNAFSVRINGTNLVSSSGISSFPFLKSGDISSVGFTGTGALDDFVARTTDPYIQNPATKIGGEGYASLCDAIAEAGETDVIVLQSDNAENITLTEGQTFKLKANGFTYSGTVTSASGYRLETSGPDANGVITYSQAPSYKPSININFTNGAGNGLTTSDDVGLGDYAIPGTSWNNLAGSNGSLSALNAADSTGATFATAASVTITGTRGYWSCSSLTAASDLRHGYIDENDGNPTPTITVSGIPYEKYRVVVYAATDTGGASFGYITINGKNYTYVNDALTEGTTAWGNAGAQDSAEPIAEGTNVLVSAVTIGSTLTVVGHRGTNARGCIAAIQIVEVVPEITENDLVINVYNDTTYTVSEAKTLSGTVYVVGSGTLTLDGSAKITAATIDVGPNVTMNINADRLDADAFVGAGTVVYDGSQPVLGKGWTDPDNWIGTVWVKNIGSAPAGETANTAVTLGSDTTTAANNTINSWGNANSYVKFTNVRGHVAAANCPWTLVLEDGADTYAWYNNNGWTGRDITIAALEGDGTFYDQANVGCRQLLTFTEASNFTGSFNIAGKRIGLGGNNTAENNQAYRGTIEVASGKTVTVAAGKTWTTGMGFRVYGTINATGTLAADSTATACAVGTGTVVFGGVPSPTGDKWWKNAAWTGTVEIKGATALNGDYAFNDYGNSASTLKLTNCSGWLMYNYTCVPALEIGGTFTWNDGSSGLNNTFKVATLKGSGTISIPNQGAATAVWQITENWSGFTGAVVGNNGAAKRILVFGSTLPTTATAGVIYVSEGATLDLDNASSAWWGVGMGFVVDGTVKASARNKWGGGTTMVLGATGVLEFVSSSNTDDQNTEMGNITGTGTLKFSSSAGWRAYPKTDANMPATTLTIQTELADSLILPTKNNGETVIGSLAGSKNIRSDWSDNGANGRILTVTQSKDTEWQGKFVSNRITQFNVVAPAEGTPGTLTLSGTQEATIPMQVNGAVNLTGTWKGATTVAGTFGGTGSITGNLTLSDGATLIVDDVSDPLAVTGDITATGTINVKLPEGTTSFSQNIISATGTVSSSATFKVYVGGTLRSNMKVKSVTGGLKIVTTGSIISYF